MCAPILDLSSPSTYNFLILVNVSPSISTSRWPIHSPNCIAWQHTRASTTNANELFGNLHLSNSSLQGNMFWQLVPTVDSVIS
ncbi:hypothetical protein V6Z11_D04G055300 [Gossypium hirsutum]